MSLAHCLHPASAGTINIYALERSGGAGKHLDTGVGVLTEARYRVAARFVDDRIIVPGKAEMDLKNFLTRHDGLAAKRRAGGLGGRCLVISDPDCPQVPILCGLLWPVGSLWILPPRDDRYHSSVVRSSVGLVESKP